MNKKNVLVMVLAMLLVAMISVGGTIAWLTAETGAVTNTFTVGDINIDLKEHAYDVDNNKLTTTVVNENDNYKMVPGLTMPKDPYVTVLAASEPCYVFVKIVKNSTYDTYLKEYTLDSNKWEIAYTSDDELTEVYMYKTVVEATATANADPIYVLSGGENGAVTVKTEVTKAQLDAIDAGTTDKPTLTFTAYAIQSENLTDGVNTAAGIWELF